jgi:hypothetical protein
MKADKTAQMNALVFEIIELKINPNNGVIGIWKTILP